MPVLSGAASVDLKTATATAIGNILSRLDTCPDDVAAALMTVLGSDAEVSLRTAAAVALGKGKEAAAKRAELERMLRSGAGSAPSEG